MNALLMNALDQLSGRKWLVHEDNREGLRLTAEWIAAADFRRGLFVRGPVGTGKSKLVEAVGRVLLQTHGKGIRRIEATELVTMVDKSGRQALEAFADHGKYPHLCIEDLDTETNANAHLKGSEGINTVNELLQVRYKRWELGWPMTTYFTSNATNSRLMDRYGPRAVSRMQHMSIVVPMEGPDMRSQAPTPVHHGLVPAEAPPASKEAAAPYLQKILADLDRGKNFRRSSTYANSDEKKSAYLTDLMGRVRGMTLSEILAAMKFQPYAEALQMLTAEFDRKSPVTYAEYALQVSEAEKLSTKDQTSPAA